MHSHTYTWPYRCRKCPAAPAVCLIPAVCMYVCMHAFAHVCMYDICSIYAPEYMLQFNNVASNEKKTFSALQTSTFS